MLYVYQRVMGFTIYQLVQDSTPSCRARFAAGSNDSAPGAVPFLGVSLSPKGACWCTIRCYTYVYIYIYVCIYIYIYVWYIMISYIPKKCQKPRFPQARRWHPANSGIGFFYPHLDPLNKGSQCGTKLHTTTIYLLYYLQSAATSLQTKPTKPIAYISPPPPKKNTCFDYFSGLGIRHPKKGTPHHISKALRHLRCFFLDFIRWLSWNWGVCGVGNYDARWW